jgi:hypothetical protein
MTGPWVIIGCGLHKGDRIDRADRVYRDGLVPFALRWARSVTSADRILFLSAAYGLIPPERYIQPYDVAWPGRERRQPGRGTPIPVQRITDQARVRGVDGCVLSPTGQGYLEILHQAGIPAVNPFDQLIRAEGHTPGTGYMKQTLRRWHGCVPSVGCATSPPRSSPTPAPSTDSSVRPRSPS